MLNNHSFELLLFLVNATMQEIDILDNKDYISAKVLLRAASFICTTMEGKKVFIKDLIKKHHIWKNLEFWAEIFVDGLTAMFKSKFAADMLTDEKKYQQIVGGALKAHSCELIADWGFQLSEITDYVERLAKEHNLLDEERLKINVIFFYILLFFEHFLPEKFVLVV